MSANLPSSLQFSPYFAAFEHKSAAESSAIEDRIDLLPEAVRAFLFDESLPDALEAAAQSADLPEQYSIAFAKIVFLAIMGDIPLVAPQQLFEKLGVAPSSAATLARALDTILRPLVAARGTQVAREGMRLLQPLTARIPPPPPSSGTGSHNIIDLRNKPET